MMQIVRNGIAEDMREAIARDAQTIVNLQAEVDRLNKELEKLRKAPRVKKYVIPDDIKSKFKNHDTCWEQAKFQTITCAVRRICFPPYKKLHRHGGSKHMVEYRYTLPVDEMTPEQYARYIEIIGKVADVIAEYEYIP